MDLYKGEYTSYWKKVFPAIIFFSLLEGLRYGRGADYFHYMYDLSAADFSEYSEPLYNLFIFFFREIFHFPFYVGFVIYSFLYVFSVFSVLKSYTKIAIVALPLWFIICQHPFENLVRQYIAISFILLAYSFWLKGTNLKSIILCLIIGSFFHFMVVLPAIVLLFVVLCVKNPISLERFPMLRFSLLSIFLVVFFFWKIDYMNLDYIRLINIGDNSFQGYIEDSDRWFGEDGINGVVKTDLIFRLFKLLVGVIIIYYGCSVFVSDIKASYMFICSYLTLLLGELSRGLELIDRYKVAFSDLLPFFIAYIILNIEMSKFIKVLFGMSIFYIYVMNYLLTTGKYPYAGCGFIWDSF